MQNDYETGQLSIYDLDSWCGKMYPEPSPAGLPKERTSGSFSRRLSELKSVVFQSLDLTPGAGNLLGEFYWELISPWRGDASTLNTGVSPREEKESSLSQILQDDPEILSFWGSAGEGSWNILPHHKSRSYIESCSASLSIRISHLLYNSNLFHKKAGAFTGEAGTVSGHR